MRKPFRFSTAEISREISSPRDENGVYARTGKLQHHLMSAVQSGPSVSLYLLAKLSSFPDLQVATQWLKQLGKVLTEKSRVHARTHRLIYNFPTGTNGGGA